MEIRHCTREEYAAFLDTANDVFGYGAGNEWFQKSLSNCTPYPDRATDGEIGNHFISCIDGALAGGLGVYPMEWVVADTRGRQAVIPMYGVGQVCCKPEYRNRGVMTALLNTSAAEMRERGLIVGYLGGLRFRYMHFGYDFGCSKVTYNLNKKQFETPAPGLSLRRAKYSDWQELNAAYNELPSRIIRGPRAWERQFMRENYAVKNLVPVVCSARHRGYPIRVRRRRRHIQRRGS